MKKYFNSLILLLISIIINNSLLFAENNKNNYNNNNKTTKNSSKYDESKNSSENFIGKKFPNFNQISVYFSEINGKSDETLYRSNHSKISHLEWDIKNLKMLNLAYETKLENFGFKLSYGNSINKGSNKAIMIDSDWLKDNNHDGNLDPNGWTHRSFSKVRIDFAQDFEFYTTIHHPKFEFLKFKLGIRDHHIKFTDNAINLIYSVNGGFRNFKENLNNQNLVDYQQKFTTPYVGISLDYTFFNNFNTKLFANYSNLVMAEARDHHKFFNDRYKEESKNGRFINYGFNFDSKIIDELSLGFGYEYVYYPLNKGIMQLSENGGKYFLSNQPIGIKSKFTITSLYLKYNFDLNKLLINK